MDANSDKARGKLSSGRWVLCVGAGISRGHVPTWMELARRVINRTFKISYTEKEFEDIVNKSGWSLDSWIQAAANEYVSQGDSKENFVTLLENELYGDIRDLAKSENLEEKLVQALNSPRHVDKDDVFELCNFVEKHFSDSTLFGLANTLIESIKEDKNPYAIITFNADTLLLTLIELIQRKKHYEGSPPYSHPDYHFRPVLRPFTGVPHRKILIFHIHGSIKPRSLGKKSNIHDSRDSLVFLEEEYFQVATNSSSWLETLFMYQSQTNNLVFVGLSMSDPNIRRWLGTGYKLSVKDLTAVTGKPIDDFIFTHYWIRTKSKDTNMNAVTSIGLAHLGVKTLWLDDWSSLGNAFSNLLSFKT